MKFIDKLLLIGNNGYVWVSKIFFLALISKGFGVLLKIMERYNYKYARVCMYIIYDWSM